MSSVQQSKTINANEISNVAKSTSSPNPTPVIFVLYEGTEVSKDFYDRVERHVYSLWASRPYKPWTTRQFFRPGFWRKLTTQERRTADQCLTHLLCYRN